MGEIIFLGLVIGIIFYELTDISPGGIVVPGIIAYYLYEPARIAMTIAIGVASYIIVRWLSRYLILYGKRKFALHIMIAVALGFLLSVLTESFALNVLDVPLIGYIIPGIIGHEIGKQGIVKTLVALCIVVLMTGLVVLVL